MQVQSIIIITMHSTAERNVPSIATTIPAKKRSPGFYRAMMKQFFEAAGTSRVVILTTIAVACTRRAVRSTPNVVVCAFSALRFTPIVVACTRRAAALHRLWWLVLVVRAA